MSIRYNKEEAIRWLKSPDGTKVWVKCNHVNCGWQLIEDPDWVSGCVYVVDDQHAELRKELVDKGKPTEWETPDGEDPIAYHANRIYPDWEADWSDHKQEKWYVYKAEKYDVAYSWAQKILGTIYMSNSAAEKIADALNYGELIIKDTK